MLKNKPKINKRKTCISVTITKELKTQWEDLKEIKSWAKDNHYLVYWETKKTLQVLRPDGSKLTFSVCNQAYFDKLKEGEENDE